MVRGTSFSYCDDRNHYADAGWIGSMWAQKQRNEYSRLLFARHSKFSELLRIHRRSQVLTTSMMTSSSPIFDPLPHVFKAVLLKTPECIEMHIEVCERPILRAH